MPPVKSAYPRTPPLLKGFVISKFNPLTVQIGLDPNPELEVIEHVAPKVTKGGLVIIIFEL